LAVTEKPENVSQLIVVRTAGFFFNSMLSGCCVRCVRHGMTLANSYTVNHSDEVETTVDESQHLFYFIYFIKMQRAIWPLTCFKNIQSISYS